MPVPKPLLFSFAILLARSALGQFSPSLPIPGIDTLYRLGDGKTVTANALWIENPRARQFGNGRSKVVIADLKGPAVITMIHFALPANMTLNRKTVLRIWWDGEKSPSVESPLVDFFCDPNGTLERVESALVNKKRGWNCYFPMPFARSARVEVASEDARYPGGTWDRNPCYSYVTYRTLSRLPPNTAYFHAQWRQDTTLLAKREYEAVRIFGRGQFVGWNMTIRGVATPTSGYAVDENVKMRVDGERDPSVEWQGLEDSFGFSWGFPEQANGFAYTGYQPYYNGAAAYRFTIGDAVPFTRSFKLTVGPGKNEPAFQEYLAKPESLVQMSSVVYWYQMEPHVPFAAMPAAAARRPTFVGMQKSGPSEPGDVLEIECGDPKSEDVYLADGWDYQVRKGYAYNGFPGAVKHCWADFGTLEFDLTCPKEVAGTLRLYILDGDNFEGGRQESIRVANVPRGRYEAFQAGRWIDVPITPSDTRYGRIPVVIANLRKGSNAVVSKVRFVLGSSR